MKTVMYYLIIVVFLTGCTHGALKVASSVDGPWILTNDGAIHAYNGSGWDQKEPPGTAVDFEICGSFLVILTKPNTQGKHFVKSRDIYGGSWTTYPLIESLDAIRVACDGNEPVIITPVPPMTSLPSKRVWKYYNETQSWKISYVGAKEISVMNSRLFFIDLGGKVWSGDVDGGPYHSWGEDIDANKIAGDANGYPWVAIDTTSDPLYKWDYTNQKWTFGFNSGPVYDMDIQSYVRMYILSDPQISSGGYTLYSHELYSGGWTTYPLPSY